MMRDVEKSVMLQMLDSHWKDHLAAMDHLRQSIHLRGYAQKNPAQEYKRESFNMFTSMLEALKYEVISTLSKLEIAPESEIPEQHAPTQVTYQHAEFNGLPENNPEEMTPEALIQQQEQEHNEPQQPYVRSQPKVGRNDPCPCGSGKKYKQCHGKLA